MKSLLVCVFIGIGICAATETQAKHRWHPAKKQDLSLVEAFSQRTLPGRNESAPETSVHIVVVWRARTYPETFFWRGENGWQSCSMLRAYKMNLSAGSKPVSGSGYRLEDYNGKAPEKGDTLMLTPVTGGKFPIPAEIPVSSRNTLYYKTGGSGWKSFPIDTVVKKRDIIAP